MIEHSWFDLRADALEQYNFRAAGDPRSAWNIMPGKIEPDQLVGVVQYYTYDVEKLVCCMCNRAVHHSGAVVVISDQSYRLIGRCCGRKHFQSEWTQQVSAFNKKEKHALQRKRAKKILAKTDEIQSFLFRLRAPFQALEDARRNLKDAIPNDFPVLCREVQDNKGVITFARLASADFREQGAKGSLTSVREEIGWLDGWTIYSMGNFRNRLENCIGNMRASIDLLRRAIDRDTDASRGLRLFTEARDTLYDLLNEYSQAISYATTSNWNAIEVWLAKKNSKYRLTLKGSAPLVSSAGQPKKMIPLVQLTRIARDPTLFETD